jgi:IMP cyclohydrolase
MFFPSDPNELALNPKVSYCVVIYSKHSRKNIILNPFPTVVDPSDPNELALNPKVSYCVVNVLPTVFTVYNYTITYFRV